MAAFFSTYGVWTALQVCAVLINADTFIAALVFRTVFIHCACTNLDALAGAGVAPVSVRAVIRAGSAA